MSDTVLAALVSTCLHALSGSDCLQQVQSAWVLLTHCQSQSCYIFENGGINGLVLECQGVHIWKCMKFIKIWFTNIAALVWWRNQNNWSKLKLIHALQWDVANILTWNSTSDCWNCKADITYGCCIKSNCSKWGTHVLNICLVMQGTIPGHFTTGPTLQLSWLSATIIVCSINLPLCSASCCCWYVEWCVSVIPKAALKSILLSNSHPRFFLGSESRGSAGVYPSCHRVEGRVIPLTSTRLIAGCALQSKINTSKWKGRTRYKVQSSCDKCHMTWLHNIAREW